MRILSKISLLLISFAIISCESGNGDKTISPLKIEMTDIRFDDYVTNYDGPKPLVIRAFIVENFADKEYYQLDAQPLNKEKIVFELSVPPSSSLKSIESFEADGITISNQKARWGDVMFGIFMEGYSALDAMYMGSNTIKHSTNSNGDRVGVTYCYVDRDVTIKGATSDGTYSVDLRFTKGWNAYSCTLTERISMVDGNPILLTHDIAYSSDLPSDMRWGMP